MDDDADILHDIELSEALAELIDLLDKFPGYLRAGRRSDALKRLAWFSNRVSLLEGERVVLAVDPVLDELVLNGLA